MEKCIRDYTVINSQPSIEAFENLVSVMIKTFGLEETIDDMFYYGVFMKTQNYANYSFEVGKQYGFEIPYMLLSECAKENEKIDYVEKIIEQIMRKEISKPEWMKYVELNMTCNIYGQAPSTFFRIKPRQKQYENLCQTLIEFLYSPNLTITMVRA